MGRRVFISHAANDPAWTEAQIEAVAQAILQAGIGVDLDLWRQRDAKRHLSLSEWQEWMDAVIDGASHILCMVSPHYLTLWGRRPDTPGGLGVAFESIRLVHGLYLLKQRNHGRILTLRPDDSGFDCIPSHLALDCPNYRWTADHAMLISHLAEAPIPAHTASPHPTPVATTTAPGTAATTTPTPAPATPAPLPANPSPAQPKLKDIPTTERRPAWASASGEDSYGRWADLTVNGVTQRMRWIPPTGPQGFWMGSPQAERDAIQDEDIRKWANESEHVPRRVVVAEGFWLADTPCTQALWEAVADVNPSHFATGTDAAERPVEQVSWDEVIEQFINRFAATPEWGAEGCVCLPSEVQWEYACRAGTRTAYWWGDGVDADKANFNVTGQRGWGGKEGTTPVKRYAPNPWGLYDMHGNVWEWCLDAWRERLDAPEARPDESVRVVRGGSWLNLPVHARAACRGWWLRVNASRLLGFRFALRSSSQ
ncbi:MAG: hypothetical protein E6Q88_04190 [Lysobacteraceae bacterium]|nr:MAG: hypothetical protein E6Q88_04190 [Xanthomonadaceae bacterium]